MATEAAGAALGHGIRARGPREVPSLYAGDSSVAVHAVKAAAPLVDLHGSYCGRWIVTSTLA